MWCCSSLLSKGACARWCGPRMTCPPRDSPGPLLPVSGKPLILREIVLVSDLPETLAMQSSNPRSQSGGLPTCPACGHESLSERPRHADQPGRDPQLLIVGDNRAHLYELFQRAFAHNESVRVLLDRRVAERRGRLRPFAADPRHGGRRPPPTADPPPPSLGVAVLAAPGRP